MTWPWRDFTKVQQFCMALKHDTCIFPHRLHDNHSFKSCDTCPLVVGKVSLFWNLNKDCNIVNSTICLTTTSFVICVVVGG